MSIWMTAVTIPMGIEISGEMHEWMNEYVVGRMNERMNENVVLVG